MATTVTHVVDPDAGTGYDYDSLFDWEVGEQGDLTGVRDEISVAKCRSTSGTADSTALVIDGWTTSATQYIKIWTDPSESHRHDGIPDTGYRFTAGAFWAEIFAVKEDYVRIDGLSFYCSSSYSAILTWGGAGVLYISNSLFFHINANAYYHLLHFFEMAQPADGAVLKIWNNIFYSSTGRAAIYARAFQVGTGTCILNNTCVSCGKTGQWGGITFWGTGTVDLYNNLVQPGEYGSWDYYFEGVTVNSSNNISGDTSSPNSTFREKTVVFKDANNKDFHLDTTDTEAKNNGASDPGSGLFSDDIDGQSRTGSWDIGADEYVAAVSALSISVSEALSFAEALD
jgi:hypothetical protein